MRIQRVTTTRRISNDGVLNLDSNEVKEFCRQHPGKAVVVRVELLPVAPSEKSLAYYWKVVVPTVQRGLYNFGYSLTQEDTDYFIRATMPVSVEERFNNGRLWRRVRPLDELSAPELNELIEQLKVYAAENLFVYIEEPEFI